ncbi:tripartite tricarboxylate transporter permease [Siccirubricoccus sp. KC 17139]|uniref:Tripartite tricarboxylate transporter permease n=1 Tax=Siccirubricoccus soli TaxID=2899147 RepID=A0ABT1DAT2_9PROT|nr:tripartite tricarboxylate transporter permease [Siccirubricoccus soli]MCO6418289.1 tripartite tricarboxylate transporter permease [Siccirubricoccus soli]MCP2684424.1 tripartite tricarboxylate transporter permease [Siccirubricoccus soli]
MDIFANLAHGFAVALSFQNLLFALIGALIGTAIGVLPGIGPVATISLLLPITFGQPATTAIIMLAGIYYGAQYGGSTTAILLNLPGEISSVVTTLEGYKMARNGRAGAALATSALGSFFAGSCATLLVAASGPVLTSVALSFGPADYFSLMLLGLIISAVLAQGSVLKSVAMVVTGVALGLVGTDVQTGQQRFTFGIPELSDGLGFAAVAMGMFGIAEIILNLEKPEARSVLKTKVDSLWLTKEEWKRATPSVLRGTLVGSVLGILPGGGASLSAFGSYMMERKISKGRHLFGQGAIEGVAGPEAANNAAAQTSFIPLLTLGIPSNAVMALMVGALIIQGIQPGPRMVEAQPDLFWGLIASMWIGNVMLLIINLPMIGMWVKLLQVPYKFLYPAILVFCSIGSYSINNNVFDVYMTVVFAVFGVMCAKLKMEPAPLLIGFVLGPMMEEHLRRAMLLSRGDPMVFVQRPISATMLAIAAVALIAMLMPNLRKGKEAAMAG